MAAKGYRISAPFFESKDEFDDYVNNEKGASPTSFGMLAALQGLSHIYAGTVDPAVVAHRRRRNKAARRSRRINRLAARR